MTAGRSSKKCPFKAAKVDYIDFKSLQILKQFISQYGRIVPRYYTGVTLQNQKKLSHAIKLAREMALLPYVK